ncbi:MAG: MarR family transcriptional regulator [Methanobrevibacter thaueri]|nr:MarR family transcriptional regulator [Methanobrevibacter thaueri]
MIGYVMASNNRYQTLKTINTKYLMPKQIAEISELKPEQISKSLKALKDKNLVVCKNEKIRKGRIYQTTRLGLEILEMIDNIIEEE